MKTKLLTILFVAISILFVACDKESLTEAVLGSNSITLSGDITDSFDSQSIAGLTAEDSLFSVFMAPSINIDNYEDVLLMMINSTSLPSVGTYDVNADVSDLNAFRVTYGVNESTTYLMTSGTVKITSSSSSKVAGTFDMTGQLVDLSTTPTGNLKVVGKFSTIPIDL